MFDDLWNLLNPNTRCSSLSSITSSISNIMQVLSQETKDSQNKAIDVIAKIMESQKS